MSEQEENQVIGRLVEEYAEVKRKRELVAQRLSRHGDELAIIAERLSSRAFTNAQTFLREQIVDALGLERLKDLLAEHHALDEQAQNYLTQLRAARINLE